MLPFAAKAIPLSRQGLNQALSTLGMAPNQAAALWAVFEVETAGLTQGFGFRQDKRPQILFERHIFRMQTQGRFNNVAPAVSGPAGDYGALAGQYLKLEKAIGLCEQAGLGVEPALKSASRGIGQVMGFNHNVAGFATARVPGHQRTRSHRGTGQRHFRSAVDQGVRVGRVEIRWTSHAAVDNLQNKDIQFYDETTHGGKGSRGGLPVSPGDTNQREVRP